MIQTIIVAACVVTAIVYAAWRIRQTLRQHSDPCYGCRGCDLKKQVCEKKNSKKFGQSK